MIISAIAVCHVVPRKVCHRSTACASSAEDEICKRHYVARVMVVASRQYLKMDPSHIWTVCALQLPTFSALPSTKQGTGVRSDQSLIRGLPPRSVSLHKCIRPYECKGVQHFSTSNYNSHTKRYIFKLRSDPGQHCFVTSRR